MIVIRVDFNSQDADGHVLALAGDADGALVPGEDVLLIDDAGNQCLASLLAVEENGLLVLQRQPETWLDGSGTAPEPLIGGLSSLVVTYRSCGANVKTAIDNNIWTQ